MATILSGGDELSCILDGYPLLQQPQGIGKETYLVPMVSLKPTLENLSPIFPSSNEIGSTV